MLSREQIRERIFSWVPKDMGKNFFHPQSPQNIKRLQFFWVGCAGLVIVAFSYGIVTFLFEKAPLLQQEDTVKVTPTSIETATKKMNMEEIFRHKIEDGFKQLSDKFANLESQILGESKRKQVQDDSYDQSQEPSQLFSQVMNDQGEDQVEDSKDRLNQQLETKILSLEHQLEMQRGQPPSHPLPSPEQQGEERGKSNGSLIQKVSLSLAENLKHKLPKTVETTIPAGAFAKTVLLSGLDASSSMTASSDPRPMLLRLLITVLFQDDFRAISRTAIAQPVPMEISLQSASMLDLKSLPVW
jgi:hypothetical protein